MEKGSSWMLLALLWAALACTQGDAEAPAAADPETAAPAELQEPRDPREIWPEVLAKRDLIREIMRRPDIWEEDLEELGKEVVEIIALTDEVYAFVKNTKWSQRAKNDVALSAGDVRVAFSSVRGAVASKTPGAWRDSGQGIDDALRAMEMRFADGFFKESIKDRPDFLKQIYE